MVSAEDVFKAMGDPVRMRILRMLARNGEMCVCRIIPELGMSQPAVSHHLAVLRNAGLVSSRKEGLRVHYSLVRSTLCEVALASIEDLLEVMDKAREGRAERVGQIG